MLPLALSAFEKAGQIPSSFWLKLFLVVVAFFAAVIAMRKLLQVNKFVFVIIGVIGAVLIGFNWIYERNEPAFLSSFVDSIAPFFPSKGAYEITQASDPLDKKKTPPPKH